MDPKIKLLSMFSILLIAVLALTFFLFIDINPSNTTGYGSIEITENIQEKTITLQVLNAGNAEKFKIQTKSNTWNLDATGGTMKSINPKNQTITIYGIDEGDKTKLQTHKPSWTKN